MRQMQNAEHCQEQEQQRHDARETDAIEDGKPDLAERSEAAQRRECDEEAGDSEEDGDAVATVAPNEGTEHGRPVCAKVQLVQKDQANPDVKQDDGEDGQAA